MILQFTKNIHFTRLVKAAGRIREFNFRKLPGDIFHGDVSDDRGNRIIFTMQKDESNTWKIVESELPRWISSSENELNQLIEAELSEAVS